jgi:hypothetical protein
MTGRDPQPEDDQSDDVELEFQDLVEETSCCEGLVVGVQVERVLTSGLCSRQIRPDLHRFFGRLRALRTEVVLTTELPIMCAASLVGELLDGHVPEWIARTPISSRRDGASSVLDLGGPGRCYLIDSRLPTTEADLMSWLPAPAMSRSAATPSRPLNESIRSLKNAAIMVAPALPARLVYEIRCVAAAVARLGPKGANAWLMTPLAAADGRTPQEVAGDGPAALWHVVRELHSLPFSPPDY